MGQFMRRGGLALDVAASRGIRGSGAASPWEQGGGPDAAGCSRRHSSSSASEGAGGRGGGRRRPAEDGPEAWRRAVEGLGAEEKARQHFLSSFQAWLGKKVALHHARGVAPAAREEGRFDNLEADIIEGAPQCLQFLANSLESGEAGHCPAESERFGPPHLEDALAERLRETVCSLRDAGCKWRWQLEGDATAQVERMFTIIGSSRSGVVRRGPTDILFVFGQQFVLKRDQTKRFLDRGTGLTSRMEVLQELLMSDMVLVADVALTTRQSSVLHCRSDPETQACSPKTEEPLKLGEPRQVEHVLRLEMQLTQERNYSDDEIPILRPSSWQIVDWNWLCHGNHPSLPRGRAAPW